MTGQGQLTWAHFRGSWLPGRVLEEDPQTGTLEVRVTDRTGVHEVWLRPEQVRGYTRGSQAVEHSPADAHEACREFAT